MHFTLEVPSEITNYTNLRKHETHLHQDIISFLPLLPYVFSLSVKGAGKTIKQDNSK